MEARGLLFTVHNCCLIGYFCSVDCALMQINCCIFFFFLDNCRDFLAELIFYQLYVCRVIVRCVLLGVCNGLCL